MKTRVLLLLLVGVLLISLLAGTLASCGDDAPSDNGGDVTIPGITPDYPAPPLDSGAQDANDDEEKLDSLEGGGAVGINYEPTVEIDLSDKKVSLYYKNPKRSTHDVTIQLVVQDVVLAESGLLTPNKYLTQLSLKDGVSVPEGVYAENAKIVVRFYDPTTHACSIVNSELKVTVTARA